MDRNSFFMTKMTSSQYRQDKGIQDISQIFKSLPSAKMTCSEIHLISQQTEIIHNVIPNTRKLKIGKLKMQTNVSFYENVDDILAHYL